MSTSPLAFPKDNIKVLLLEGVDLGALKLFKNAGYTNVEYIKTALPEDELLEKMKDVHFLGIRSRTQVNKAVLDAGEKLLGVGCFCIGTNQVDLEYAKEKGVTVFNAPFSNTRSVAELTIGAIIMLMRGIPEKNAKAHRGEWGKSAVNSFEVREKTLGIVGYGNIGSQVSVLAESLGMKVYYYDPALKLRQGLAEGVESLEKLLQISDVVTLHVPDLPETRNMIDTKRFEQMKEGSFLINYARGKIVNIDALCENLESGKILGTALDVFPQEPKGKDEEFVSPLRKFDNALISPHIGGSTEEAQKNIGTEVANKLIGLSDTGTTETSVNFPEVSLPVRINGHRILHTHKNIPGIMGQMNKIFEEHAVNINAQYLQTNEKVGYVVVEVSDQNFSPEIIDQLKGIEGTLKVRVLY
jgi:D-3-phosphoglycerate dehydrogenase